MEISPPNEHGVLTEGCREIVAPHGRAYAAITIALCDDGLYRIGIEFQYSYGGMSTPVFHGSRGYPTTNAARVAGLESLLRHWHRPNPSDPVSVREELRILREQIENQLTQPTLF